MSEPVNPPESPPAGIDNPFDPPPQITVWHHPDCARSRRVIELLRPFGLPMHVVEVLKQPPAAEELRRVLKLLGTGPRQLLRIDAAPYRELGLADPSIDDATLVRAMAEHPALIDGPVVLVGDRAMMPRVPELVLELLVPEPPPGERWLDVARRMLREGTG